MAGIKGLDLSGYQPYKKMYAIIVLEDLRAYQLVGILLMTKWDQNLQVEFTLGGFHSGFRNKQIFYPFFKNILDAMSASEVELITVFAETWHDRTQKLMDDHGFKIWGIFPGNMIRWSHAQNCFCFFQTASYFSEPLNNRNIMGGNMATEKMTMQLKIMKIRMYLDSR